MCFAGPTDNVRCFYCDGGLKHWQPSDDPWTEHRRWFTRCPYVIEHGEQLPTDRNVDSFHSSVRMFISWTLKVVDLSASLNSGDYFLCWQNSSSYFDLFMHTNNLLFNVSALLWPEFFLCSLNISLGVQYIIMRWTISSTISCAAIIYLFLWCIFERMSVVEALSVFKVIYNRNNNGLVCCLL